MNLNDFDKKVLERLPFRNGGCSIAELAEGILGRNDLPQRQHARSSLLKIGSTFDLVAERGRDDLTRWPVNLYSLASGQRQRVQAVLEGGE